MNRLAETSLYLVIGLGLGFGVGYFTAKKSAERRADADIKSVKEHYAKKTFKGSADYTKPEVRPSDILKEQYSERIANMGYSEEDSQKIQAFIDGIIGDEDAEEILKEQIAAGEEIPDFEEGGNPTEESDDSYLDTLDPRSQEWKDAQFQSLVKQRDVTGVTPYVIDKEEYFETNDHYDKTVYTYFEEDDTLVDENDQIVPDVRRIVGLDALDNFGIGNEDDDRVYVRNDRMSHDFEVLRNPLSYVEVVLGEPPHDDDTPRVMKMREDLE